VENFRGRAQIRVAFQRSLDARFIANQQEFESVMAAAGQSRAFNHHTHALIAAHRVNGDTREAHWLLLSGS